MRSISKWVLAGFLSIAAVSCAKKNTVPSEARNPRIVLEATNTLHGVGGYANKRLLVRLTDDGKVEWDERVGNTERRWTGWIPSDQVISIIQLLESTDKSGIARKMGPYYQYMDTGVELEIRTISRTGDLTFSVINPWPSNLPTDIFGEPKPMPSQVKSIICEIVGLRSQLSGDETDAMCKAKVTTSQ